MEKKFYIPARDIKPLAVGRGSCIASNRITIDGAKIGFMYREHPDDGLDSGWRFFSVDETQLYADEPGNFGIYDINTIANYDSSIIDFLDSPIGSAFEISASSGGFIRAQFPS